MGHLSTHVLDTANGQPAAGMRIDFSERRDGQYVLVKTLHTNADGRTDRPVLQDTDMRVGEFELSFHVADYFRRRGTVLTKPPFIDQIPVRFGIHDPGAHYHVPLLCTPWSYSTYRGS
ncbi:MAG: hydroxyisourate hydrolase [Betaproteobacteria bacterium]|nr:hydroxyisourate hydrolase [Betaproteobacteria bacterium]